MNILKAGEALKTGEQLVSQNGRYFLALQGDGNLVLYETAPGHPKPWWSTDTGRLEPFFKPVTAVMQQDGNFVLYNANSMWQWASGTQNSGATHLSLQDDRNLVLYTSNDTPVWSTHTEIITPQPDQDPVTASKQDEVGYAKVMKTNATLYRNGLLAATTNSRSTAAFSGLKGRLFFVCVDAKGRAVWLSKVFSCQTRCALLDPTCPSFGTDAFSEQFPAAVGPLTTRLDIYHGDNAMFTDFRKSIIKAIKDFKDILDALGGKLPAL